MGEALRVGLLDGLARKDAPGALRGLTTRKLTLGYCALFHERRDEGKSMEMRGYQEKERERKKRKERARNGMDGMGWE